MAKGLYKRNGIWWARFKVRGQEYRESLRTRSAAIAEKRLKALKEQIQDRVYFGESEPVIWQAAVISWIGALKKLELGNKTAKRYGVSLGQVREWLDDVPVQKINHTLLKTIVKERARHGATNATIRRDLTAISSVLGHCVDEGWIEENKARTLDRSRIKEKRDPIVLPHDDDIALVLALKTRFIDIAELSNETGMRQDECVCLGRRQIDRKRRVATIENGKWNITRQVPLSDRALEIIDAQPQYLRTDLVFWLKDGQAFNEYSSQFHATVLRVAQKAAQSDTPFRPFKFHDLRHKFAVDYLRNGKGSIYDLQQILGHQSIKTTEVYLKHLTPDERRAAINGTTQNAAQDQRFVNDK